MNNVNLLASATAGTPSVSGHGKPDACQNCTKEAASFADLLKNAESAMEPLGEQQAQAGDAAATPLTGDQQIQNLSASVLLAFAANDEDTIVDPTMTDEEAVAQMLDPTLTPPAATMIPTALLDGAPKETNITAQLNSAGKPVPAAPPENPIEPTPIQPKSGQVVPDTPNQAPSNLTPQSVAPLTQGDASQTIASAQANDNRPGTPSAPQMTATSNEIQGASPEGAEPKSAPASSATIGAASPTAKPEVAAAPGTSLPQDKAATTVNAEIHPASSENKTALQAETTTATTSPAEDRDGSGTGTKEAAADAQPVNSTGGNTPTEPSRPSPLTANAAPLSTPVSKTGASGANTPAIGKLATAASNDDAPQATSTANDGEAATQDKDQRPASLMQGEKTAGKAAPTFQAMDGAAQQSTKVSDFVTSAMTTTPIGEMARPEGVMGATPTANTPAQPQVPLNNVAVHIAAQAKAGNHKFHIRLDPPELGRIDIRLEIGRDGQTLTHLAVEKPETLDLLRQDARQLERALQNAGLDTREGNLSFSLKEDNRSKQQGMNSEQDGQQQTNDNASEPDETTEPVQTRMMNVSSGLDISI